MAAVPRRLKRIEVYCPEYQTTATIRINDAHSSGTDHLEVSPASRSRNSRLPAKGNSRSR